MKSPYERRLERARTLIREQPSAADLLRFYLEIAGFQSRVFDENDSAALASLTGWLPQLLPAVSRFAPALADFAEMNLREEATLLDLLAARWEGQAGEIDARAEFFATVLLQPFASKLALRGQVDPNWTGPLCPFCSSAPALAILRSEGDGGKRSLLCSLCSTEWSFRRILCPNCGEEDRTRLPVYLADAIGHVRIEACESCRTYLKSIDLTRNGLAEPVVDEIATIALNIWAEEHDYLKLAPNILGM